MIREVLLERRASRIEETQTVLLVQSDTLRRSGACSTCRVTRSRACFGASVSSLPDTKLEVNTEKRPEQRNGAATTNPPGPPPRAPQPVLGQV